MKKRIFVLSTVLFMLANTCKKDDNVILTGTVTDIEGNVYKTVKIGNKWWMAESLKTTRYNDSTEIPNVTGNDAWKALTEGAYCLYDNNEEYRNVYGVLYNWYTINTGKLAPTGWHVPSIEDWRNMVYDLGGLEVASLKLRESGTAHWLSPNEGATNESGFTALPGGYRSPLGDFLNLRELAYFWFATESAPDKAWSVRLTYAGYRFNEDEHTEKTWGFSVRCVKDLSE